MEAFGSSISSAIFIILVNIYWDEVSFLTNDFEDVLKVLNVVVLISIITNLGRLFITSLTYKYIINAFNNTLLVGVLLYLLDTFPINPDEIEKDSTWESVIRVGIIISIVLTILATVFELFKIKFFGQKKEV